MRFSGFVSTVLIIKEGEIWGFAHAVTDETNPLDRIPHHAQSRPFQLLRAADVALHIHERHGQKRPILLQPTYHAFLPLGHE